MSAAAAAPSPAKKATKAKKPAKPLHPSCAVMIVEAVETLGDKKGSSRIAVKKWIADEYKGKLDIEKLNKRINLALKKATAEGGQLVAVKGSYKLSAATKKPAIKKPVAIKKAAKPTKKATKVKKSPKKAKKPGRRPSLPRSQQPRKPLPRN
jgi:histone H1/5